MAEARRSLMGDGDEAIARQSIGHREGVGEFPGAVG